MPVGLLDVEYLNLNASRSFPVSDDATKYDATGSFLLPDSFLVELYLSVPWTLAVDASQFYVAAVAAYAIGYAVSIGYDDGSGSTTIVATATFAAATHAENRAYALNGTGDFGDVVGKVVVGTLDEIARQPPGRWNFAYAGGKLDPDVVRPVLRGVSSLTIVSNGVASSPLYGDIELVAGTNSAITLDNGAIRVDAIQGAGLTETCLCAGATTTGVPLLTINGIAPDGSGNFNLVGNTCIDIAPATNGLTLTDTCSQPCCGCAELASLTAELAHVNDEAATLTNFLNNLQAQVNAMEATVLASRLGDAPCVQC